MSSIESNVYTKQTSFLKSSAERQDDGQLVSGVLLQADVLITFAGLPVDADTLELVVLPEGATIIPQLCKINTVFAGDADVDVIVGDDDDAVAADDNRWCATLVCDKSGGTEFTFAGGAGAVLPYQLSKPSKIYATLSGIATIAALDTIRFTIVYRAQA